jgi:hypothetical protein
VPRQPTDGLSEGKLRELFAQLGESGNCRTCRQQVWWIRNRRGNVVPIDVHGVNHAVDCPAPKAPLVYEVAHA